MKKRDAILDFTSLLDVTLIVIFFFVIFSHLDTTENQAKVDAKVRELKTQIELAEKREEEAHGLSLQLEEEIEIVRDSDERRASNVEGMLQYGRSGNIKLILVREGETWILRVNHQEKLVSELTIDSSLGNKMIKAFEIAGYDHEDTIFCDFVFNGSQSGTASAYRNVTNALSEVKTQFNYVYYSETDLSIGEE